MVALYTVAALESRRRALLAAGLLECGVIVAVSACRAAAGGTARILGSGMVAAALGLGLYSATRRAYLQELHDRAERLEHERDQQKELSAAAERARITREMHDIVAHHLAVMIALSDGAAAASAGSSPRGRGDADGLGHRAPGTGRHPAAAQRPGGRRPGRRNGRSRCPISAGSTPWSRACARPACRSAMRLHGAPAPLSAGVQLTVYRLIQEALTNTLKHAGSGASAVVRLAYLPGEVRLDIEDDGAGVRALQPATSGRGLDGMRQRVQTFGGEAQAAPDPAGWRVSAQLQLDQEVTA